MSEARKVHFVGIGGIGMSGLAEILLASGYQVSGSDLRSNRQTERLAELGAEIHIGHRPENVGTAQVVVFSSAIPKDNPELIIAREKHLSLLGRGEMLAELMRKKRSLVVAGSHGKTTTSALIATMLMESGRDPTAVIGGCLKRIAGNARMGSDEWFVCESDESDGSFLKLLPTVAVITNIDAEHLNHYGSFRNLERAFVDFANRVPFDGTVIVCGDDRNAARIVPLVAKPVVLYGTQKPAQVLGKDIALQGDRTKFSVWRNSSLVCTAVLPLVGRHYVLDALGAAAAGLAAGLSGGEIQKGLEAFEGIERRLEWKGEAGGIRVYDDYAHHPTEIQATLESLRCLAGEGTVRVLLQPHRFTRLRDLWNEFVMVFDELADLVVLPVYAAGEKSIPGTDSERLVKAIRERKRAAARYADSAETAVAMLLENSRAGDLLVTLGAGDVTHLGPRLVQALAERRGKGNG